MKTDMHGAPSVVALEVVAADPGIGPGPAPATRRHFVATYHYIREENSDGVTGLTPGEFEAQVRAIAARYRVVGADEFHHSHASQDGLALITFDDAVRDQLVAASILDRLRLPAVFFAPMRPFSDEPDRWCPQHLLHALAEHLGWWELERHVEPRIAGIAIDTEQMDRLYHYEVPHKRRLKFALAFCLSAAESWAVLREVNASIGLRAEDWFISAEELQQLQRAGHCIGGHGFDHLPYTTMAPDDQAADMNRAAQTCNALFGKRRRPLAFPFGRYDARTLALAKACGYTMTFGTDQRVDAKFVDHELAAGPGGR